MGANFQALKPECSRLMGGGGYWGMQMKQSDLTLVLSSEAFVTMVTLRHEMQPEPVFVADDGCGNIHSA